MSLLDQDIIKQNMVPLHDLGVEIWGESGLYEIIAEDIVKIRGILMDRIGLQSSWTTLYNIFKEILEDRSGIEFLGMDVYAITPRLFLQSPRKTVIMPLGLYIKCFTTGLCPTLIVYGCEDWNQDCGDLPIHYRGELSPSPNTINIQPSTVEDLAGPISTPHYFKDDTWFDLTKDLYINQKFV